VSLCMEGLSLSLDFPGNRGYLARKTYNDFTKTTQKTFFDFVPEGLIKSYNKTEHLVTLFNGSEIQFGDCENVSKLKSLNLGWYGIDEASEIDRDIKMILDSRLRLSSRYPKKNWHKVVNAGVVSYIPDYYAIFASNPEPCFLYDDFVNPETRLKGHIFIPALPTDNPHLPPDYVQRLMESGDEDWINRYIHGSWKVFEGQIYKDFIRERNVIKPFEIPGHWNKYRSIDLGVDDPTVCTWIATDPEKNVYIYREYYESNRSTDDHAEDICVASGSEHYVGTIFDHHGLGKQLIIDYNKRGVKGGEHKEHKIIAGITRVQQLLKPQGFSNKPKLYVFDTCVKTIKEFEAYRWAKRKYNTDLNSLETPLDKDNHAMDTIKNWTITYYYATTPTEHEHEEREHRKRERELERRQRTKVSSITNY
jgi:phage terminase large subunit